MYVTFINFLNHYLSLQSLLDLPNIFAVSIIQIMLQIRMIQKIMVLWLVVSCSRKSASHSLTFSILTDLCTFLQAMQFVGCTLGAMHLWHPQKNNQFGMPPTSAKINNNSLLLKNNRICIHQTNFWTLPPPPCGPCYTR